MNQTPWWLPRTRFLSPRGWMLLGVALGVIGYVVAAKALLDHGIQDSGGGGGIDAIAYWAAANHIAHGQPLYQVAEGSFTAYAYPPVLAQMLVPLAGVPEPAFVWFWRLLELFGLRLAAGSWVRGGIALLIFPPIIAELDAANVHLIMAGICALAMRGFGEPVGPSILLKFAGAALMPLSWFRNARGLISGLAGTLLVVIVSIVVAPTLWRDYIAFLGTAEFPSGWYNLATGIPLLPRLIVAGVLALAAIRWVRLAPIAVLLAYPVVWFHALSTLVAVIAPVPPKERRDTLDWGGLR